MPFVLDASVTMAWCLTNESTPYTRSVLSRLVDTYAEVPTLWNFEVANVLAICERRQRITSVVSENFLRTLDRLDIRVEQSLPVVDANVLLPLARRYGLTAYDAAYLELSRRKNLPLATLDKDLTAAALQEDVVLLSQP